MTPQQRLAWALKQRGIGVNELDRRFGKSQGFTSRALRVKGRTPRLWNLELMTAALGVRLEWVLHGTGEAWESPSLTSLAGGHETIVRLALRRGARLEDAVKIVEEIWPGAHPDSAFAGALRAAFERLDIEAGSPGSIAEAPPAAESAPAAAELRAEIEQRWAGAQPNPELAAVHDEAIEILTDKGIKYREAKRAVLSIVAFYGEKTARGIAALAESMIRAPQGVEPDPELLAELERAPEVPKITEPVKKVEAAIARRRRGRGKR